ncbi:lysophospholipid acyltransferase family protein [Candidatus Odyssella thessalonicensis]|uniref:lysophospholipid acyltransferase family protein n=1 Tax=Candidatus Odyssella thessalonicensis TaxID=84647 RepID=UPI000225A9C5|nr:lysophospholipid acyltransferase family protein [Candidatus Odyssella thessalonicensis]
MRKLRSFIFNLYFVIVSSACAIFGLPFLLGHRRLAFTVPQVWAGLTSWGARNILGLTYKVEGLEHLPKGACIIASKHQSAWETVVFCEIFPESIFVAKRELLMIPFFNFHFIKQKTIMLNRKLGGQARADLVRQAKARVAEGDRIIIYPEGTRRPMGAEPKYKQGIGAMYTELNVPVVPVALNSGLFWPRRSFEKRPGTIVVSILPPLMPGLTHAEFMQTLEERVETKMRELARE